MVFAKSLIKPSIIFGSIPFFSNRFIKIFESLSTFYSGLMYDKEEIVVSEIATGGTVEMIRPNSTGFSGANWKACSPVNTSSNDVPFRTSRWLWKTFNPKVCISPRQLVCMKAFEVRCEYLFRFPRSSCAEIPSKSPINLRCRFSLFLWIEIRKFVAIMITLRSFIYLFLQKSCKVTHLK